ncbi:myo-inositol 2-dehydrogenase/D-chiro-inositol 1-dehydrogenase [Friedmanniella endophytica]|uniref:Myo-inositol 2-dehydrogenase/D-chiro-inositol 1-dehydrogenase n=1 Tax=Microlunatus kandeliicorticis TaxID=1759536 RepID=A0A7W3P792_9ACTN|nr:Gfo/Idh/MocA family oxidoreductase [Microlunatus kandeliicorticis]MBA8795886.1 myo-inositol 2-dehydrogenase/D-chiro-inositol 1-dehydrogenase [Microlunatus kandeliicorticis]
MAAQTEDSTEHSTEDSTGRPGRDRPLRIAMIGAGGIARAHLPAWLALGAQVNVYSLEGTEQLIADCGGGTACSSLEEAFADRDAVDVVTSTDAHREIVEAAAAAGLDVLCEKPICRTAADTAAVLDACERAGVQLYPGHVVRFFPAYATMHAAVADGAVGRVAVQRFSRTGSRPVRAWFHDPAISGGIVLDQIIHDIDFACWNAGDVATVFGRATRTGSRETGVDTAQLVLTHVDGTVSYVTGTWARPGTVFRTTFEIAGPDGLLRHDSTAHPAITVDTGAADASAGDGEGTGLLPAMPGESPFLTEIREIAAAFAGGPPPRVSAADGLRAVAVAEAGVRSIAEGRAVAVAEVMEGITAGRTA